MTQDKICPPHRGGAGITDMVCHNHESVTQQGFHNLHCRMLACPRALSGASRHLDNVPTFGPRNKLERFLKFLDRFNPFK